MANTKAFKVKNGLELQEYAKSINDTAVDVFVYDTRKDSDGGAWRHRTQNTSWYNETLNTSIRGSRKEFPAVAVIVGHGNVVTIYDGDDPDLPMWLEFPNSGMCAGDVPISAVSMLNGILCAGGNTSSDGVRRISFIDETFYQIRSSASGTANRSAPFSQRATYTPFPTDNTVYGNIVNDVVNDVAMTVLPNAPIDAATGLPVPTIAVATDGGVSVIKDDGTVVDITGNLAGSETKDDWVYFDKDNSLFMDDRGSSSGLGGHYFVGFTEIPSADTTATNADIKIGSDASTLNLNNLYLKGLLKNAVDGAVGCADATGAGLNFLDVNKTSVANSMIAYTTSDYATGWMNGNIKLATLSDTDATNVSYNNTVTNPDFASGITGYTANNATLAYDSGNARMTVTPTALYGGALQTLPATTTGKRYIFGATITTTVVNQNIRVQISGIGATQPSQIYNEAGTQVVWGIYDSSGGTPTLQFSSYDGTNYNQTFYVDNVFFSEAEEDRSINGNALQVFGTVTKSAVATGADLVAYSGWSSSNYLEQPPNPDLNFGTSDFCIMGWVKKDATASYRRFFSLQDPTGVQNDNDAINIKFANESTGGELYAYLGATEGSIPSSNVDYIGPGNWGHFALVRQNMTYYMYVNGNLIQSKASTMSKGSSTSIVRIGQGAEGLESFSSGSCALFRVSRTAPSPEQIKKIYEDEKVLFQEGAQATLYGSSDAVTALAYDDSTNLLHVGTSAGRSVFQGLRRVDNTTDAVGTTISASNSMIAED